jgi:hypothetical protein
MEIEDIINRTCALLSFEQPVSEIRARLSEAGVSDDLIWLCLIAAKMKLSRV